MNIAFEKSFLKDLKGLRDKALKQRVRRLIQQVEKAQTLREVGNVRKMEGHANFYRIRIGQYRVGIVLEAGVVDFVRFLHRKDVYRYFP